MGFAAALFRCKAKIREEVRVKGGSWGSMGSCLGLRVKK